MGWLSASLIVALATVASATVTTTAATVTTTAATVKTTAAETTVTVADVYCQQPLCIDDGYEGNVHTFTVEGHLIFISYAGNQFSLDCDEWQALDSPAMPRFSKALNVESVELSTCPLPASRSLKDALAALNVTLQQGEDGESTLILKDLPSEPQLTARYFIGLEHLTNLQISTSSSPPQTPEVGFLTNFRNLHSLNMGGVPLPAGELGLPRTLSSLVLIGATVKPLPDMLIATPYLRNLTLQYAEIVVPNETPKAKTEIKTSALENLWLIKWKEQRLVPLERCDSLLLLDLLNPSVEELPNRWVAACPHLETLALWGAEKLTSLPPRLLEGATSLKYLTINGGVLQSLPNGLLEGTPNLIQLNVGGNELQTLSSASFVGPALQSLLVDFNNLDKKALDALASLTALTVLNLNKNPLANLCDKNGYSNLKSLAQLKELHLRMTNVTHICQDWREDMRFLALLDLSYTQISQIEYNDLYYTRDASVKIVRLLLHNTPFDSIRFTEEDYNMTATTPIGARVELGTKFEFECNCDMEWVWAALQRARKPWVKGITCNNGYPLQLMTIFDLCPSRFEPAASKP